MTKYTINLFHTQSKVMVNGRGAEMFNDEHSIITNIILLHEDFNKLDRELHDMISEGLSSIGIDKTLKSTQNLRAAVGPLCEELHPAAEQSQNPKTPCRVDHGQPNEIILDDEDSAQCPCCSEFVNTDGIFCEKC